MIAMSFESRADFKNPSPADSSTTGVILNELREKSGLDYFAEYDRGSPAKGIMVGGVISAAIWAGIASVVL